MEGNKTEIKKLVISQPLSQRLVALGLIRSSAFDWVNAFDIDNYDDKEPKKIWQVVESDPEYTEGETLPAWTSEELRVMIGWHFNGCEMREHRPKPMPGEHLQFVNFYSTSMKTYTSSAEGNGEWLEHLIAKGHVKVEEANERYKERFKPE